MVFFQAAALKAYPNDVGREKLSATLLRLVATASNVDAQSVRLCLANVKLVESNHFTHLVCETISELIDADGAMKANDSESSCKSRPFPTFTCG
jgi:hypothetical protein